MIKLGLQTFHQGRGGNVTGVIFIELDSGAFPAKGWSDFPVVILGWWAEALLQLHVPGRREVLWRFMDGSHTLTLTRVEGDIPDALPFAHVQSSLCEAAERVALYCDHHKITSRDVQTLRVNIGRLRATQPPQGTGARLIPQRQP